MTVQILASFANAPLRHNKTAWALPSHPALFLINICHFLSRHLEFDYITHIWTTPWTFIRVNSGSYLIILCMWSLTVFSSTFDPPGGSGAIPFHWSSVIKCQLLGEGGNCMFICMANSHEMGTFRFFGPGIMKNYPIFLILVSYVFSWDGLTGWPTTFVTFFHTFIYIGY